MHRLRFWFYWPWLFVYFAHGARARVLIYDGEHILLVKGLWKRWFDDDGWSLPGGGIARREQPVEAAVRELKEELDIAVSPTQLTSLGETVVSEYGLHYRAYFFALELPRHTRLKMQPIEIAEAAWIDPRQPTGRLKPEVEHALAFWRDADLVQ